ncbi:ppGpp synthetase catalytic domain-containing protein (RelA/SpoT-type nucleotidyltranferase) [Polaromonas sp. YR568]|uniref:GTP pyrophosphokinase n=1 Tax=Polaromonas sp. YR568 TaxID=1855301 RepID=UPI0008ED3A5B|nr:hypothetical protein [Polaromonas sp. YR568]SFU99378.1 ppGpp synthetase catalytic domain-containing protein (RelA/SpoT-type nucleotidyltranferase) [Polaromonas sp. YR568]
MNQQELEEEYQEIAGRAGRLRLALLEQVGKLLESKSITLGVPLEGRVKTLASISEKIERKSKPLATLNDLDDLIGVRAILLFNRDVSEASKLIEATFDVLSSENTAERLGEAQFGYQSQHYVLRLPKAWLSIPSLSDLGTLKAELQVRTLAQHIWAAASHKLQYKQEQSVPPPVRRAIHRVSALLETVDLEFERVLQDRETYVQKDLNLDQHDQPLNVDSLQALLSEMLPPKNKSENETYGVLLEDLLALKVDTAGKLRDLLAKHMNFVAAADAQQVERRRREQDFNGTSRERIERGVFYRHVGWTRNALRKEFGGEKVDALFFKRKDTEKPGKKTPTINKATKRKPTAAKKNGT